MDIASWSQVVSGGVLDSMLYLELYSMHIHVGHEYAIPSFNMLQLERNSVPITLVAENKVEGYL